MKFGAKKKIAWLFLFISPLSCEVIQLRVLLHQRSAHSSLPQRECTRLIFSLCNHFGVTLTSDDKVCLGKLGKISFFPFLFNYRAPRHKNKSSPPMFYPKKTSVIISERESEWCEVPAEAICGFILLHGTGAENEGIKLVPILHSFLACLDKTQ